jgi:hypothetical protein
MTDISQEAREAAAELYRELQIGDAIPTSVHDLATMAEIEMGKHDDWPEVQFLAAAEHRGALAERERCAVIVENYPSPMNDLPMALAMRSVAQAIRDAKENEHGYTC